MAKKIELVFGLKGTLGYPEIALERNSDTSKNKGTSARNSGL